MRLMKKVLIFSLAYYPRFVGGAEVAIKEITDRIAPEEIEFHMITLRFDTHLPRVERIGNVMVHRIGFTTAHPSISDLKRFPLHLNKHLFQILAALHAVQLHARYRYDGIWAMMAHSCGIPAGIVKMLRPELRYLLTLQEGDPPESIERLMRPLWPLFAAGFRRSDALQAISTFLLAWGRRMGARGIAEVIPNGVALAQFSSPQDPDARARMRESFGTAKTVLISVSRLVRKNGLDAVVRALARLPDTTVLVLFGIGPEETNLRTLAKEMGVEDRVRFMGEIGHDTLPCALSASDIFIRPSRSEGLGNAFIEAMAVGIPVIATQEGGLSDFIFDAKRNPGVGATAWAVDRDAPEQIAAAVTEILEHPEATKETVRRARALVQERYQWDTIAMRMRALFMKLFG